MKNILLPVITFLFCFQLAAQTKVGTIDSEYILSLMPELTKVQEDIKVYSSKLETDLNLKVDGYQAKVEEYKKNVAILTEPMKKTKQDEIVGMENDIKKFRQNGSQLVQIEQNRLLQPLYQKIGKVLEEMAKSQGYTQVLTVTSGGLAYIDTKFDLTEAVMKKLGIPLNATGSPSTEKK